MDLLNLARTTKALRELLMQKSRAWIWRASRQQFEDFPDCPPFLSEPQYASLVFDHHCVDCGRVSIIIPWQYGVRYCIDCLERNSARNYYLNYIFKDISIPHFEPRMYFPRGDFYHKPDVNAMKEQLMRIPEADIPQYLERCAYMAHITDEYFHAFPRRKSSEIYNAECHSFRSWVIEQGWSPELDYFGLDSLMSAYIDRRQSWFFLSESMINARSHYLPEWMQMWREVRLEKTVYSSRWKLFAKAYKRYLLQPPGPEDTCELMPHIADISTFLLVENYVRTSSDSFIEENGDNFFVASMSHLSLLISQWRQEFELKLVKKSLLSHISHRDLAALDHETAKARLQLASTVFVRRRPGNAKSPMLVYPSVLATRCFVKRRCDRGPPHNATSVKFKVLHALNWSSLNTHDKPMVVPFKDAAQVIRVCGLDPKTATVPDMDALDKRLCCEYCLVTYSTKKIMTWRMAIQHAIEHKADGSASRVPWTLASSEDEAKAKSCEGQPMPYLPEGSDVLYCCALCRRSVGDSMSRDRVKEHLATKHSLTGESVEEVHYFIDPNIAPRLVHPFVIELVK